MRDTVQIDELISSKEKIKQQAHPIILTYKMLIQLAKKQIKTLQEQNNN
jgi:hypothetical protein